MDPQDQIGLPRRSSEKPAASQESVIHALPESFSIRDGLRLLGFVFWVIALAVPSALVAVLCSYWAIVNFHDFDWKATVCLLVIAVVFSTPLALTIIGIPVVELLVAMGRWSGRRADNWLHKVVDMSENMAVWSCILLTMLLFLLALAG